MKFVFGKAHPLVEAGWYLQISTDDKQFIKDVVYGGFGKAFSPHDFSSYAFDAIKSATVACASLDIKARYLASLDDIVQDRIGWFMNQNGGMCPRLHDVEKTVECDCFPPTALSADFLLKNVKISQWPNGQHYYAKLPDGREVEVNDTKKWDSWDKAKAATAQFLRISK